MFIPDPDPDSGSRGQKALNPGSISATLLRGFHVVGKVNCSGGDYGGGGGGGDLTVSAGGGPGGEEGVLIGLCTRVHFVRLILAGSTNFPHAAK